MRWLRRSIVIILVLAVLFALGPWGGAEFAVTTPFFSGKKVLVLIPHQDDELNLAGGILEQYVQTGSEVTLVYSTNGDYNGLAEERSREVLAVAEAIGIPAENVIYLGYGDQWEHQEQEGVLRKHLYFSVDGDAVWTSHFGATHTYGTAAIDCYSDCDYTRDNFLADLLRLLRTERPDVIYCTDYDAHHDHMALDLFFEEAMGILLAEETDYHPTVYKGFCYGTAWYAEADFVGAENLRSSQRPAWEHWERLGIGYDWADRVRLPMSTGNLSRMLSETDLYQTIRLFESQNGHRFAQSVFNGDKVFWERRTDSLLYRAAFSADGEAVTVFNDFKLKDSVDFSALVNTGLAFADTITVELEAPTAMDAVWLYDSPVSTDNILAGYLLFDDGSRVDFGALEPGGAATKISFEEKTVGSFELHLTQTEGEEPGLAEIEAYCGPWINETEPQLLMAADENGDFAYDYWTDADGCAAFTLYAYPAGSISGWEDVTVTMTGAGCTYALEDGLLRVSCPTGCRAEITVTWSESVSTTFTVSNPSALRRMWTGTMQSIDAERVLALDD